MSLPLFASCGKKETVYLHTFTRVFDARNTLLDMQSYTYDEYGRVLTHTSQDRKVTNTYDRKGNLLTIRTETLKDGTPVQISETRMTYDKKGNMITTDSYSIAADAETHLGGLTMEYDDSNRLLRESGSETVTEYVYTAHDGYTATETLTATGEVVCVTKVEKNPAGLVTSRVTEHRDRGSTEIYTATYSEGGDLLTEVYTLDGTELETYRYEYDTHGDHSHLARVITLRGGVEMERTVYGYDGNHNRTTGTLCAPNGAVKRTYIYEYMACEVKKGK